MIRGVSSAFYFFKADQRSIKNQLALLFISVLSLSCFGKDSVSLASLKSDRRDQQKAPVKTSIFFLKQNLKVGSKKIIVEIADNDERRQQGLMYRKKLSPNVGMLFIFPESRQLSFWMKNTLISLDIGYFDSRGRLIEVFQMAPPKSLMELKLPRYQSSRPAQFALEMNQGWFKKNGIEKGTQLSFLLPISSSRLKNLLPLAK